MLSAQVGLSRIYKETHQAIDLVAGHGAVRAGGAAALLELAQRWDVPVATTFHGEGVFPDDHPNALGAVGFLRHGLRAEHLASR
ncbi:MAG: hypothetical protein ACR2G2_16310 [Pseudonocardia sp.]